MCWQVLLDVMLNEMKRVDETFREMYRQPHFVGSYYENLRVGKPCEFDINLELQLPISESNIEVCFITILLKLNKTPVTIFHGGGGRGRSSYTIAGFDSILLKLNNENCLIKFRWWHQRFYHILVRGHYFI